MIIASDAIATLQELIDSGQPIILSTSYAEAIIDKLRSPEIERQNTEAHGANESLDGPGTHEAHQGAREGAGLKP